MAFNFTSFLDISGELGMRPLMERALCPGGRYRGA